MGRSVYENHVDTHVCICVIEMAKKGDRHHHAPGPWCLGFPVAFWV